MNPPLHLESPFLGKELVLYYCSSAVTISIVMLLPTRVLAAAHHYYLKESLSLSLSLFIILYEHTQCSAATIAVLTLCGC